MTVIVGLTHNGKVYMAGDRGMSDKSFIGSILTPKVKKVGHVLIGYSASQGAGQIAHYLDYPPVNDNNIQKYVRTSLVKVLMDAYQEYGLDYTEDDKAAVDFLIGVHGHLFELSTNDWSVSQYDHVATGSGFAYAMGSLYSTRDWDNPRGRVKEAVNAAIRYSPSCQGPVDIIVG